MLGFYNRAGKSFPTAGGGRSSRRRSNCAITLGVSSVLAADFIAGVGTNGKVVNWM
jgi:hypothetical protein